MIPFLNISHRHDSICSKGTLTLKNSSLVNDFQRRSAHWHSSGIHGNVNPLWDTQVVLAEVQVFSFILLLMQTHSGTECLGNWWFFLPNTLRTDRGRESLFHSSVGPSCDFTDYRISLKWSGKKLAQVSVSIHWIYLVSIANTFVSSLWHRPF